MEHLERRKNWIPLRAGTLMAGSLILLSACATVKQDQYESDMSQLRQEIQEGNEDLETRMMREIQEVENQVASLAQELTAFREDYNVTVERMEAAVRFNAPVHFAFDDDAVQPQDREILDRFASVVQSHYDDATITVEGFADPSGNAQYNLALGQRRADSVREYLVQAGVPSDRLRTVSYGEAAERQIMSGQGGPESGWQNRRVAMVIDFRGDVSESAPNVVSSEGSDGN